MLGSTENDHVFRCHSRCCDAATFSQIRRCAGPGEESWSSMRKTFDQFSMQRHQWEKLLQAAVADENRRVSRTVPYQSHLEEIRSFGSNPGALRMFAHVPPQISEHRALVVVLHGCTQSAADYDLGAGWSTLADRFGFCLLLPEQQACQQSQSLLQLVSAGRQRARDGEAQSIRQMVDRMVSDHDIDPGADICHRTFSRRRDDLGDACDISRMCSRAARLLPACPMARRTMSSRRSRPCSSLHRVPRAHGAIWSEARRRITDPGRAFRSGMAAWTRR